MTRPLDTLLPAPADLAALWTLDPQVVYLNHGSFGACPQIVQDEQKRWMARLERQPVDLLDRDLAGELRRVRECLGALLGADPEDLALVTNATEGVGCVLRSIPWQRDDEVLVIDHAYNACKNAAEVELERWGGSVRVAAVPLPIADSAEVVQKIVQSISKYTRLLLIDHITSPTGLVLPIEQIVSEVQALGVDVLVDGAHSPGHVPVDLTRLGAAYWTGNCHKWLCAPKGAAVLHVRRDRQHLVRPLIISHGANRRTAGQSQFRAEFDWTGTRDPSAWLTLPVAIGFLEHLYPGGLAELQQRNRQLVLLGRDLLCQALGTAPLCPDDMIGQMASVELPAELQPAAGDGDTDALHHWLRHEKSVELPVLSWQGRRLLRISAQAYNSPAQYQYLADLLAAQLAKS